MAEIETAIGTITLSLEQIEELKARGVLKAPLTTEGDTRPLKVAEVFIFTEQVPPEPEQENEPGGGEGR